jgi:hypothetical protein
MNNEFIEIDFDQSVQNDRSGCEEKELWSWKTSITRCRKGMVYCLIMDLLYK